MFEGGNTHRFADLKGLEFTARGVGGSEERADHFYFYLDTDERRTFDYFGGGEDIHGAMVTHNDRLDLYTGSDYVWVHWRLNTKRPAGRTARCSIWWVRCLSTGVCRVNSK